MSEISAFILGMCIAAILVLMVLEDYEPNQHLIDTCEKNLIRTQHCVLVAVIAKEPAE
jgi:hypothetical protein